MNKCKKSAANKVEFYERKVIRNHYKKKGFRTGTIARMHDVYKVCFPEGGPYGLKKVHLNIGTVEDLVMQSCTRIVHATGNNDWTVRKYGN